jgi:nucleoside-diphosphate-sugar epimerase
MKIVVTGGAGRLGELSTKELVDHGHGVLAIDKIPIQDAICDSSVVDLLQTQELATVFARAEAVIHLARKKFPYTSNGFNPTSRTWNIPDVFGDAQIFSYNVTISYNVVAAAFAAGVKKLVMGSSLTIYGFYYPCRFAAPEYLPVDEAHPLAPQDPYSVSKLAGEHICDAFVQRSEMQIASLRFAGISADLTQKHLRERRKNPLRWAGPLWTYIDVRDAAVACRLAVETDFSGHEPFNTCAPKTIMPNPTVELAKEYFSGVTFRTDLGGNWSGYDCKKAWDILGFTARHLLEDDKSSDGHLL